MIMKKILTLVLVLLIGTPMFSQSTERQEKLGKVAERNNPQTNQNTTPPQTVIVQPTPYYNPYTGFNPYTGRYYRRNQRSLFRRYPSVPPPAPLPYPYESSPQLVARPERNIKFGLMTTLGAYEGSKPTIGMRFLLGNKSTYGLFGWEASARNPYSHYDNISIIDVESWEDESVGVFNTTNTFELGLGTHMDNNLYVNFIGYGTTKREYLAFMDEEYVLSPNGQYSINGQTKTLTGLQIGIAHRSRRTIVSTELGLLGPKRLSMGIGLFL